MSAFSLSFGQIRGWERLSSGAREREKNVEAWKRSKGEGVAGINGDDMLWVPSFALRLIKDWVTSFFLIKERDLSLSRMVVYSKEVLDRFFSPPLSFFPRVHNIALSLRQEKASGHRVL